MGTHVNSKEKVSASLKYIDISVEKARRVVNQIRGRSYEEALILLEFMPYRACQKILKVLSSAAANANHNLGLKKSDLFVSEVKVDKSNTLKRFRPRAQGRGYPIRRTNCHISITVSTKPTLTE
uniref:ribosomal protein L22 n=1 Tax=Equisetum xylochaetum TaxID=2461340 RepID=UPI0021822768|nr:ribosomal protein L22 [Equisetum xylochaetum]UVF28180.1 ribosomal protein L22 [Equisetum xylochaetum]